MKATLLQSSTSRAPVATAFNLFILWDDWQANLESSKNAVKAAELIKGYELLPELWEEKAVLF